ncbi:MAG: UDP-N-acetylglucosamine 2-epimerase (non-hydrolyzing) [Anaerolineaceae bacterium]|nr:UDP-N-acetylglucosamine 2-epimerase (non-hydrolyzing) [Anaerolineaceae bacterium]
MKVMTVVGTRPEFIQIAPLTRSLRRRGHQEILVNTGQHYDDNMSRVFFRELDLPEPEISLGVGGGTHAEQTGQMMIALEPVMLREKPDFVVVYGDTNSTIAGALTAAKLHMPIVHVEAGLRSFDRNMPEEINRVLTDHISNILFSPTNVAVNNLKNEGVTSGVYNVGDVRTDVVLGIVPRARERQAALLESAGLQAGEAFALATIHRASNTDSETRLRQIVDSFGAAEIPVLLPVHPRLRKMLDTFGLAFNDNVRTVEPLGFLDLIAALDACEIVITDSGGLQKEAYMLRRPTITVRDTTEWIETVEAGWNRLCEPEPAAFLAAIQAARGDTPAEHPDFYGAEGVSDRMIDVLETALQKAAVTA